MAYLRAATASSEEVHDAFACGQEIATRVREKLPLGRHSVGVLFASINFDVEALVGGVLSRLDVPLVGCTTYSEASDEGYFEDSAVLMVLTSDVRCFGIGLGENLSHDVDGAVASACDAAARMLAGPATLAVALPDAAFTFTGEAALATLTKRLGPGITLVGGLPGDGGRMKQTLQVFGGRVVSNSLPVLLIGGAIEPVVVTRSGWLPIGQKAVATKTSGATVFEINGKPAMDYLKRYVSNVDDPSMLAMFPLALVDATEDGKHFVIRAPFSHDKSSGSVTYGGTIPEGATVQLVKGTRDDIIDGARDAAQTLVERVGGREPSCLLFFSCAGRKLMLGLDTKREIDTMLSGLKEKLPVAGFYSYGEIGPLDSTLDAQKAPRFHNTTLVLCAIVEPTIAPTLPESASAIPVTSADAALSKQERVLTRKIDQLQRKLEQIDRVARENEKVGTKLYRELDEMSKALEAEKDKVSALLRIVEKYVPQGARDELERYRGGAVALGGRRVRRAILFSDLRGFTTLSERLEPGEVVALLNIYLSAVTAVILAHAGDINEYIGDAILAVFHDAKDAVAAAAGMQDALAALREKTDNSDLRALRMGIGLHIGDVVEGNIGTAQRMKFGVIGDTVNVAARIQDRSREGKHSCIFVSEAVYSDSQATFDLDLVGDLTFKGKTEPMRVYEVLRRKPPSPESGIVERE